MSKHKTDEPCETHKTDEPYETTFVLSRQVSRQGS